MTETIVVAVLSLAGTLIGTYLANRKSAALIAYRLEQLEKKVAKHNGLVFPTEGCKPSHRRFGARNMKQQKRTSLKTTTKRALWFCLGNGVGWVWCSYILAYLGKESIAEKLSQTAVTEIVGVVALYCLKSLFEKRKGFGAVGKKEAEETDQEI